MRNILTTLTLSSSIILCSAQDLKIKKDEILLDKRPIGKLEKQKEGYRISSMDGSAWFIVNTANITQSKNKAPIYWLELTGSNGNLRETEYREIPFSFSKEKWMVMALLNSDTGLLTSSGINKDILATYFQTSDRAVSEKWDRIISQQKAEIAKEEELAAQAKLTYDGSGAIRRDGEIIGYLLKRTVQPDPAYFVYSIVDASNSAKVAEISFYRDENLNRKGVFMKLANGEMIPLNQLGYSFNKIDINYLSTRIVYKAFALGLLGRIEYDVR